MKTVYAEGLMTDGKDYWLRRVWITGPEWKYEDEDLTVDQFLDIYNNIDHKEDELNVKECLLK